MRSRDSVGVRVQMQDCGGAHSWCHDTYACRGSAADTPGAPGSWVPNGWLCYARMGALLGGGSCPSLLASLSCRLVGVVSGYYVVVV